MIATLNASFMFMIHHNHVRTFDFYMYFNNHNKINDLIVRSPPTKNSNCVINEVVSKRAPKGSTSEYT